jgi:protein-S-isoprenylcysteine O-methyltransferase Ste14
MENVWTHYSRWGAVILWIVMYGLFIAYRLVKKEERDILKEFGQEYIEYKRRT